MERSSFFQHITTHQCPGTDGIILVVVAFDGYQEVRWWMLVVIEGTAFSKKVLSSGRGGSSSWNDMEWGCGRNSIWSRMITIWWWYWWKRWKTPLVDQSGGAGSTGLMVWWYWYRFVPWLNRKLMVEIWNNHRWLCLWWRRRWWRYKWWSRYGAGKKPSLIPRSSCYWTITGWWRIEVL